MTIRELALNWIESADHSPVRKITVADAATYIGWMSGDDDLPDDLTPEAFAGAWNDILDE